MSAPHPARPPAGQQQGSPPGSPPSALVVEDDDDVRILLSAHLERRGWLVHAVATGEDALVAVARHRPALAVVDLVLPGVDGIAVLNALRADPTTARCHAVLTTMLDRDTLDDLGADATLPKPFTRRDVDLVLDAVAPAPAPRTAPQTASEATS